MPKKRQPREIWQKTRIKVLERDFYKCVRCDRTLTVKTASGHQPPSKKK